MEPKSAVELELLLDEEFDRLYERLKKEEVRWAGFFRRAFAFSLDLVVVGLYSFLLFYLGYVGYRVGLAAHGLSISLSNLKPFVGLVFFAWFWLLVGYFVLLHGIDGRTVGKWLFGLRVVGRDRKPIGYRQAFIRTVAWPFSALWGIGLLWILWSREKRAWHDLLAGTWVIRER